MANAFVQFRIDEETRREADRICARLGIDLATYMRISIAKLIEEEGVPFEMRLDGAAKPGRAARSAGKPASAQRAPAEPAARAESGPAAPAARAEEAPQGGRRGSGRAAGITDMSFD